MKRLVIAGLCLLLVFFCGCERQETTYQIAEKFMDILWNVDYETFSETETDEFAAQYYSAEYLESYERDKTANAGVKAVREERLKSAVTATEEQGRRTVVEDGTEYIIQSILVDFVIESYEPDDPEMSYFEEGKRFRLIYDIYFAEENGALKIDSFAFRPEEGELLPKSQKKPLTAEEMSKIQNMASEYIYRRFHISYLNFDAAEWEEYFRENLTESFLKRDGIDKRLLEDTAAQLTQYRVVMAIKNASVEAGGQKRYIFDGEKGSFYYWVKAEFAYTVEADETYFQKKDAVSEGSVTEMIYFEEQGDSFKIAYAEFTDES